MTPAFAPLFALVLATGTRSAPTPDEVAAWAASSECPTANVRIDSLTAHDLTGDGVPEAIVVASTCLAGTGGPDVRAVVARGEDGKLVEIPLPRLPRELLDGLIGTMAPAFAVSDGLLVETWTDVSGREAPLVVRYRWKDDRFVVESTEKAPTHPTSFDCGRATKETERAVCAVKSLAALDVALARAYAAAVAKAPPSKRVVVRDAQRRWLAERDTRCMGFKFVVDCLEEAYQARLAELGAEPP